MKLYIAFCQDRHFDPVIEVFTDLGPACKFVRDFMEFHMAHTEGIKEETVEGYELFLSYGYESDHAFVEAVTLDQPRELS